MHAGQRRGRHFRPPIGRHPLRGAWSRIAWQAAAEPIQLTVEYDPLRVRRGFAGAGPKLVERIRRATAPMLREARDAVACAAKALEESKS